MINHLPNRRPKRAKMVRSLKIQPCLPLRKRSRKSQQQNLIKTNVRRGGMMTVRIQWAIVNSTNVVEDAVVAALVVWTATRAIVTVINRPTNTIKVNKVMPREKLTRKIEEGNDLKLVAPPTGKNHHLDSVGVDVAESLKVFNADEEEADAVGVNLINESEEIVMKRRRMERSSNRLKKIDHRSKIKANWTVNRKA